ncbi:MAG TPA: VOC family protein [Planctomycetaceae bacterium]|nr:VOC family protein [Planctomycetaceae bacterium]
MGELNNQINRAVWFDIPVSDLDRAIQFYKAVLAIDVFKESFEKFTFAVLDHKDGNGGCLVIKPDEISDAGLLLYLNAEGRIRDAVLKTTSNGGKVLEDVTSIGPHGFRAVILDSEGNRLALHSNVDA